MRNAHRRGRRPHHGRRGHRRFCLAKRKAGGALARPTAKHCRPTKRIEAELRDYLALYQADEHPERIVELRRIALDAMGEFARFTPYLTGPVLAGIAGPYAQIELQLFPESSKEVELFLLDRDLAYEGTDERRYTGDRARAVAVISLLWQGVPLRLSVFDPRDERAATKTTQTGQSHGAGWHCRSARAGGKRRWRPAGVTSWFSAAPALAAAAAGFLVGPALLRLGGGGEGKALRAASFADLQGRQRRLAEWNGKVLLCNFWATWCAPCREEIPLLVSARQKYGPSGVENPRDRHR
jgi:hypothetical protein